LPLCLSALGICILLIPLHMNFLLPFMEMVLRLVCSVYF
jgi:hypothetical protein